MRTIIVLFLFGAIIGNGYNSFHAYFGTIPITAVHINPLLDWSSYLLFGFAGASIGMLTVFFDRRFRGSSPPVSWAGAGGAILLLGLFYFCSAWFSSNTVILFILIGGFILCALLYDRSGVALLAASLVAVAGSGIEIFFVHRGMYYYARPQVLGMTWWLPFLYGIGSITIGQLARALESHR